MNDRLTAIYATAKLQRIEAETKAHQCLSSIDTTPIFTTAKQNALVVTRKTKRNQGADHGR